MIDPPTHASTSPGAADAQDLRSVIARALAERPVDEHALRRGVWTYVGAERDAGTLPGPVIMVLNELVDAAHIVPGASSQALTRNVILWCVEAYFGHLGGDISGGGKGRAPAPLLTLVP